MFLLFSNKVSGSTQLATVGLDLLPESSASTSQVLDYKLGPPYPVISLYDTADTLTEETHKMANSWLVAWESKGKWASRPARVKW